MNSAHIFNVEAHSQSRLRPQTTSTPHYIMTQLEDDLGGLLRILNTVLDPV